MTAVPEYGSHPAQPAAMYSFINPTQTLHEGYMTDKVHSQTISGDRKYPVRDITHAQTFGLDGTDDRSLNEPLSPSKRPSPIMSSGDCTDHVDHVPRTPQSLKKARHSMNIPPSPDRDPNSSRRKRRKLTPGESRVTTPTETIEGPKEFLDVHAVLGKVPNVADENELDNMVETGQLRTNTPKNTACEVSKVPKQRTSYKKQAHASIFTNDTSKQRYGAEPADFSANSEVSDSTLQRKTLSLHTNGKLLSSPTANLRTPRVVPVKAKSLASTTRNFKMKNGKFVQSLEVVMRYKSLGKSRTDIGEKINILLSRPSGSSSAQHGRQRIHSTTHPFFLGNVKPKPQFSEAAVTSVDCTESDAEPSSRQQEPIAWKDIKFSTHKLTVYKSAESIRPLWPPHSLQHIGKELPSPSQDVVIDGESNKAKLKTKVVQLEENENFLHAFTRKLRADVSAPYCLGAPEKMYLSGRYVDHDLTSDGSLLQTQAAISSIRSKLVFGSSAFDRGECAGPNTWPIQYSPVGWREVLQPSALNLYEWLQSLTIHNVKSGVDAHGSTRKFKGLTKKKRRKLKDELDDFIINSDDEDGESGKSTKTAIVITGPNGCGKTASVFAVAKELGFEVFELHPGMRRSAKDIFDKVGDMAHNHLVHKSSDLSRGSSVAPSDVDAHSDMDEDGTQTYAADFLGAKSVQKPRQTSTLVPQRIKKEQKQSLILFEEADLLFDDDKGFWSGVQSLIQNSKRPVVLTCNDISAIPMNELDLHSVLTYTEVEKEHAIEYLRYLTAAEGHIIDRDALSSLYASKGNDLRASITELNLWCQMTVASKQGGLDWMVRSGIDGTKTDMQGDRLRIFSKGTFQQWLDLVPEVIQDGEAAIRYAQDTLGICASEWCDLVNRETTKTPNKMDCNIDILSQLSEMTEARSVIELLDDLARPILASVAVDLYQLKNPASDRDAVGARYTQQPPDDHLYKREMVEALQPLMIEKPTFPPSQGRLSPSIDMPTSSIATELAPYVRCIVNFDKRLEQHRNEVFGSQGKARKTRAARAAAEGGDKASTRSERWFPRNLDFEKVMRTAGSWPEWHSIEEQGTWGEQSPTSPSVVSEAGI